ncbi:hypothetical protein [uncultured Massilia sp.]|uniref:hypothetical protein n=1 Tax=uncultured Massilia sp. TaxID=169973 RepID=UPI0025E54E69|nr:hypothetical protein [uncultured Massilia sp.]
MAMKAALTCLFVAGALFGPVRGAQAADRVSRAVATQVEALFDGAHADFLYPGNMPEQLLDTLELATSDEDRPHAVGPHLLFLSGCRRHSCDEKGAVVIDDRNRKLQAIGIRHFHCRYEDAPPHGQSAPAGPLRRTSTCDTEPTLALFFFGRTPRAAVDRDVAAAMEGWGRRVGYSSKVVHRCGTRSGKAVCT